MADDQTQATASSGNPFFDGLTALAGFATSVGSSAATFIERYQAARTATAQAKADAVQAVPAPTAASTQNVQQWAAYVGITAGIVTIMAVLWRRGK